MKQNEETLESHGKKWARMDEEIEGFGEMLELRWVQGKGSLALRACVDRRSPYLWCFLPGLFLCQVVWNLLECLCALQKAASPSCVAQDGFAHPAKGSVCVESSEHPPKDLGWVSEPRTPEGVGQLKAECCLLMHAWISPSPALFSGCCFMEY